MFEYDGVQEIERAWREGLTPDPPLTVSEWADQYRMLSSKSASEPGRWSTRRTPYLKAIMDCLSPASPAERVVFMKGAQVGGTECGNNWIGFCIHLAPGPMMAVSPTVEMAKRNSKQRIDPLIEESPALSERISPSRSRDAGNTVLAKEFRGGVLVMTGANSAVGLRSMPVRYLFLDEVDGYPADVEGEGDAIQLAEARTRTFARRKILIVSTPTVAGASPIEREFEASDQRRYFVPCPHCGHPQWLRFEQLRWQWGEPHTARYVCEACEAEIAEQHKTRMLEQGEWRATVPGNAGKTVGFHLSSLYSPLGWRSWADIAAAWEQAQGSATRLKAFKNTELGETWVEEGEAPDWERLLERREDYPIGTVPAGGLLLVGGADVQKDRIEASIWAFGRGKSAWLVEHRVLMGDTAREAVWRSLAELLAETWTHASGAQLPLARFALDTGFATQEAYAFVRAVRDARVMAVKGVPRGAALVGTPSAVDVTIGGKRLRRGVKVFAVAGGIAKLELYNNLRKGLELSEDGEIRYPAGFVHLPKVDAEYLQQLCAEQLVTRRNRNGFPVREWQKLRERNEALDCYVYARAAAAASGLDRFEDRHWVKLEKQLGIAAPPDPDVPIDTATDAPETGGVVVSGRRTRGRAVVKSRWMS
ncbi:terminase [Thiohalobacter sp. COW1]|uniref:phage terminase large subunit family protein n=1 Tax=Thiohalobacter sp. COW1 TaxID=2795687 RepID=UPI001915207C|nr:phage terminase large subunit family protein [Thiohalobacter sp. COW1]BCO30099.1 terminase [Thiohalobacter sp. COW1]